MKQTYKLSVISLFPELLESFFSVSILARAIKKKILTAKVYNLRKFGLGLRQVVDGTPYGGGAGMVLRADVTFKAIQTARRGFGKKQPLVVMLSPRGKRLDQNLVNSLAKKDGLILLCGRYEGFDERINKFIDLEVSIGDYVLMGGELGAMVISEAVLRQVSGVLGKQESLSEESFSNGILEYPQYTKPDDWRVGTGKLKGKVFRVPKILLTGHHKKIQEWRSVEALKKTKKVRPDLLV